jgi:hypothetical protein
MFNSRNLGALIVDEKPHVKSWDEPQYSIQNLGIEESYGFGVLNEGQAIVVARDVTSCQNEMTTPAGARSSRSASTTLPSRSRLSWLALLRSTSTPTPTNSPQPASSPNY